MKDLQKAEQIISMTKTMRALQKDYFRTRSKDTLERSKNVERKVDSMIKEYYNTQIKIEFENV